MLAHIATAIVSLAALSSALPASDAASASQKFLLVQNSTAVDYANYVVTLVPAKNSAVYHLAMMDPASSAGTYAVTTPSNAAKGAKNIDFTVPGQSGFYGMKLPEVGDNQGYAAKLTAKAGYDKGDWGFTKDGRLEFALQAALDTLYICTHGQSDAFLSYGVFQSDGQPPVGCKPAEIIKKT